MGATGKRRFASFTAGMALRMAADAILLVTALFAGLTVRLLYLLLFEKPKDVAAFYYVARDANHFLQVAPLLVLVSLITFWLSGFYTYGRNYLSKYKPLFVGQAVSLAFLIYGFSAYFFTEGRLPISRGGLYLAWLFAMAFLIGARIWTDLWKGYVDPERQRRIRANADSGAYWSLAGRATSGPL